MLAIGGLVEPPPAQAIGLENAPDITMPTLSKATLLVAAPQDKYIIKGLDYSYDYGDGNDDGDANDDGDDEDVGEVRQRPKPPHHCFPHKSPGSPRGEGERGGVR